MLKVARLMFVLPLAVFCGAAETNSPVRSLGHGLFQVGQVILDQTNRSIQFTAAVNLRAETVEYALVNKSGKTHESIFRTDTEPRDIHVALLLLGARPAMTNLFGADGKAIPKGDEVSIQVSWTNNGTRTACPIEDVVLNRETKQTLGRGDWIYNGSNFSEEAFTAQRDGSIISIHIDPDALMNNPRPGRENDDLYAPNTNMLPAIGTAVEVIIKLKGAP